MRFKAGHFQFEFPRPALVMGILNVTPDSFSDGGKFLEAEAALDRAAQMVEEGADIIDVGGESTRPGAAPVDEAEELRRILQVVTRLAGTLRLPISVDTQKASVARRAVEEGATIINDVAAAQQSDAMRSLVARSGVGYINMHRQGEPQTMQSAPSYQDVAREVGGYFEESLARLDEAGVNRDQIVLDVGIGFGKTVEHNLALVGNLDQFVRFGRPMLLGVSRKTFIGKVLNRELTCRIPGALACSLWAVLHGVQILRTHDVGETVPALRMLEAILKRREPCSGNSSS